MNNVFPALRGGVFSFAVHLAAFIPGLKPRVFCRSNKLKTVTIFVVFILLSAVTGVGTQKVFASEWAYPLSQTLERQSFKGYGEYFDKDAYLGKEAVFPNQFLGFHTGTDLEIFPGEEDTRVPIFAVTSGTIIYASPVSGYGGLILLKMDSEDLSVLYGHLDLSKVGLKAGDNVLAGATIAYLGNGFSSQTGGERKHLHFAIYSGHDLSFTGYEKTLSDLNSKWIDPVKYISGKMTPLPTPIITTSVTGPVYEVMKWQDLFSSFKNLINSFLSRFL